jgi:hypothetical protein
MRGDQRCPCACHWNWGWLSEAFGENTSSVADIDGVIERHGCFLLIEAKRSPKDMTEGQRLMLTNFSFKPNCISVVVYGPRDTPEFYDLCVDGQWRVVHEATSPDDFLRRVKRWFERSSRF